VGGSATGIKRPKQLRSEYHNKGKTVIGWGLGGGEKGQLKNLGKQVPGKRKKHFWEKGVNGLGTGKNPKKQKYSPIDRTAEGGRGI